MGWGASMSPNCMPPTIHTNKMHLQLHSFPFRTQRSQLEGRGLQGQNGRPLLDVAGLGFSALVRILPHTF